MKFVVYCCLLLGNFLVYAQEKETIYWQTFHSPPSTIRIGDFDGLGFVDIALSKVIEKLPQYHHEMQLTTLSRALENIKQQKNTCHPSLYVTPERRKIAYFSHPSIISPANRLVMVKNQQLKLNIEAPIKLPEVLNNTSLSVAVVQGRSYGTQIDHSLLTMVESDNNRLMSISTERLETLFKLVSSSKVDLTFSYPFELNFFKKREEVISQELIGLMVDGADQYALGSIGCAKTPFGKKVISEINAVLLDIRPTLDYYHAITTWWEEERELAQFNDFFNDVFVSSFVEN
ncbi:MAG: hypothetical protein Alis3KO_20940 [Aliiglaciecola sp.]